MRQEFEISYNDISVQRGSNNTQELPLKEIDSMDY